MFICVGNTRYRNLRSSVTRGQKSNGPQFRPRLFWIAGPARKVCQVQFPAHFRKAIPRSFAVDIRRRYEKVDPFSWLGILSHSPPVCDEVICAAYPRGFRPSSARACDEGATGRLYWAHRSAKRAALDGEGVSRSSRTLSSRPVRAWPPDDTDHFGGKPIDQIRRVFVNAGGKVVRADGKAGHIGPQGQHAAARGARTRAAPGGQLHVHAGAVFLNALFQPGKTGRVRGGFAVIIADMGMDDRGPCLKRRMGAFDLFGDGDRNSRIVRVGGQISGYDAADDARLGQKSMNTVSVSPCKQLSQQQVPGAVAVAFRVAARLGGSIDPNAGAGSAVLFTHMVCVPPPGQK